MRATIIAHTRSRSGQAERDNSDSRPMRRKVPSAAATWPWGRERSICRAWEGESKASPLRTRRSRSTCGAGHSERLASVRLMILLPTREDSRRRTADGELRLGTVSMYMGYIGRQNNTVIGASLAITWVQTVPGIRAEDYQIKEPR